MRKISLLILACILSTQVFALPCKNGAAIFTNGDSLNTFENNCGQPNSSTQSSKTVTVSEKWEYYKPDPQGGNYKMTILFRNNGIQNITVKSNTQNCTPVSQSISGTTHVTCTTSEVNLTSTPICGQIIQTDNTPGDVISACGNPATREILETKTIVITTLQYNNQSPSTFTFEDGVLTDWN
ncbi:MAG: hypothetical protein SFW66_10810 [Gammaproteobacteria bacterium]|nr:hypothetical protein [Gammaproteobacteria bacterium]